MRRSLLVSGCLALVSTGLTFADDTKQKGPELYEGKTIEQWIAGLKFNEGSERAKAGAALTRIGEPAVSALSKGLRDQDGYQFCAGVLGTIGPKAKGAVPALIPFLAEKDLSRRNIARDTLAKIGAPGLPLLRPVLKHEDPEVRATVALLIAGFGGAAKDATPDLLALFADSDSKVRTAARRSMTAVGAAAIPNLKAALKDKKAATREHACEALGALGTAAADAIPELQDLAEKDRVKSVKAAATAALQRIAVK